jgi:hypothetical protein
MASREHPRPECSGRGCSRLANKLPPRSVSPRLGRFDEANFILPSVEELYHAAAPKRNVTNHERGTRDVRRLPATA